MQRNFYLYSFMTPYKTSSSKKSGVTAYEIGEDFIVVQFNYDEQYKYTYRSASKEDIETMKELAMRGKGLSTFISQNNPPYQTKF